MKKNQSGWQLPVAGALLFTAAAQGAQEMQPYLDSTNRVTLSLRMGFNMHGKFKGVGSTFGHASAAARQTPHGDAYNYDDGYVLPDSSGSTDGYTWYWGYDHTSQVNASGANTIDFNRTTATGSPGDVSDDDAGATGLELTYDRELGANEDWHHLRYGVEGAVNWMPLEFNNSGLFTLSHLTDTYSYTPGTTPPSDPYQGPFGGPGFALNTGFSRVETGDSLFVKQRFTANLWGFRLGPYLEYPVSQRLSLHLTGGLAIGLLQSEASWQETLTLAGGGGSTTQSGGGNDLRALFGFYAGLDAHYQLNQRWGAELGVQFQDLNRYTHNYGGREVEIDFRSSLFLRAGISYSF